ncbi:MAG TPA: hypothetical protein DDW67_09390 [Elusimicrobia bacterium]|nr:hypothetical protein [Elusimicrobiota bacterium]
MSAGLRLHRKVHAELDELAARGILSWEQSRKLKDRYPVAPVSPGFLVKMFAVIGVLSAVTGTGILMQEHLIALWNFLKERVNWWLAAEGSLLLAFAALLLQGSRLKALRPRPVLGELFELAGAFALQGLTVVMARHYSTGSDNWPALLGIDAALLLLLAYAVGNRFILWYALADFFFFFGAETGYVSGWGAYYLGMTYPVRFLGIGLLTLAAAWAHGVLVRGRLANFSRVYAHYGLLLINLSLWFLSLFGYFENARVRWDGTTGERLIFSALWALVAVSSLLAGAKTGLKLLRGYGMTFLIINLYTFYFQFVVANSGEAWFIHLLLTGGSMLWLGFHMETVKSAAMLSEGEEA